VAQTSRVNANRIEVIVSPRPLLMAQAWDGFFMHSYFENGNDLISLFKRRISLASESWKREPTVA
jgi:hypothetical protein